MGKMSADIALARNLKKLQATLAKAGVVTPDVKITKEFTREARSQKPLAHYEAEAVLKFLEKPARFMQKQCSRTECEEWFGTNYRSVGYCSDNCRIKALSAIGILWDPSKRPEDRWGGEPPLLIPPAALKALLQIAEKQAQQQDWVATEVRYTESSYEGFPLPEQLEPEHKLPSSAEEVVPDTTEHFLQPSLTFDFGSQEGAFDVDF